jgi:hypothetical protein
VQNSNNIGHVNYKKGEELGSLNAEWCHAEDGNGVGKATLLSESIENNDFVGDYSIQYFNDKGLLVAELILKIRKKGKIYIVHWFNDDIMSATGIGQLSNDVLSVGYRDC